MKSILPRFVVVLAMGLTCCSAKRNDFETAKSAVAQELLSPAVARFCPMNEAVFSMKNGARSVKLWVETRNSIGALVRTHFDVTIDAKSGLVKGAACLECAAEDENQKLNEAMAELQAITPAPK
jgi:hypothetical protein